MFDADFLKSILKEEQSSFKKLAQRMNVPRSKNKDFSKFLFKLVDRGEIFATPNNREFYIPKFSEEAQGVIKINARAFGFVDLPNDKSVFVSPNNVNGAMDGDEVLIKIFQEPFVEEERYQGIVVKILNRNKRFFVGRVIKKNNYLTIKPFDPRINGRFAFVDDAKIKIDDEVKVKIVDYNKINKIEVVKILGNKDDVSMDILIAIEDSGIQYEFNQLTIAEAEKLPKQVNKDDLQGRKDLRERLIVTIDGDDTKDFDDAIEVHQKENGNYILGVHIADVTHYVQESSALDDEAKQRGTSVYLADRVIPMLPRALSNGICSLNPNVDRLVISCEMEIDQRGQTVDYKIYQGVINSKARLTYQEVNKYYRKDFSWKNPALHKMLDDALALSKIIRTRKESEGYIDFEIEESKIVIDPSGKTSKIVPRERLESEMLIEDFMVRANETVAHHVFEKKLNFIYRVHDKPDLDRVMNLNNVVRVLGMDISIPSHPIPKEFAKSIQQIKETRFDDFMKLMMLRTMAKAEYSPKNIGHFGLASKFYTHFTSPIRRYPDLMVHRMLREYFFHDNRQASVHFGEILPGIAETSSMSEQRAMDLERKVADIKKAEFYEKFIGKSFKGSIVSIAKFGFFVEFPNKVDGLVHISTLIDSNYKLDQSGYVLKSAKRSFTIGDKVDATVLGVTKDEGKIDLILSDLYQEWKAKQATMMKNNHHKHQSSDDK